MQTIFARNQGQALVYAIKTLHSCPIQEVGPGLLEYRVVPYPISFVLLRPDERVIPWSWWNGNPFSGFLDGLSMVVSASTMLAKIGNCQQLHTCEFMIDQIVEQTVAFKQSMKGRLDVVVFDRSRIELGHLFTTAMCRYTMVQEYLAAVLSIPMGTYTHVCSDLVQQAETLPAGKELSVKDPYGVGTIVTHPMIEGPVPTFVRDASMLMEEGPTLGMEDRFIKHVAVPMHEALRVLRSDRPGFQLALKLLAKCRASDWRVVSEAFVVNRCARQAKPSSLLN
jgi:hypothetical protein